MIKGVTNRAYLWSSIDLFGGQAIQLALIIFLARLISPDVFGVYAVAFSILSIASFLVDGGLASSLIHKFKTTRSEESSVYFANILIAAVVSLGLIFFSADMSDYFDMPELTPVIKWCCVAIALDSVGIVHFTLLKRELNFRKLSKITALSNTLGGLVAITWAFYHPTVWCLVANIVISKTVRFLMYLRYSDWKPCLSFDFRGLASLYTYGVKIQMASLANLIYINGMTLLIGKVFSPEILGYYNRANSIQQLPLKGIATVLNRVGFSELSLKRSRGEEIGTYYITSLKLTLNVLIPLATFIYLAADLLVVVLLGPTWLQSAQFLRPLLLLGATIPLSSVSLNVLKAVGKPQSVLIIESSRAIVQLSVFSISISLGIEAALMITAMTGLVIVLCTWVYISRILIINFVTHMKIAILPICLCLFLLFGIFVFSNFYNVSIPIFDIESLHVVLFPSLYIISLLSFELVRVTIHGRN